MLKEMLQEKREEVKALEAQMKAAGKKREELEKKAGQLQKEIAEHRAALQGLEDELNGVSSGQRICAKMETDLGSKLFASRLSLSGLEAAA